MSHARQSCFKNIYRHRGPDLPQDTVWNEGTWSGSQFGHMSVLAQVWSTVHLYSGVLDPAQTREGAIKK